MEMGTRPSLGDIGQLPGHEGGVYLGEFQFLVDLNVPQGVFKVWVGLGVLAYRYINAAMTGIPGPGDYNLVKKTLGPSKAISLFSFSRFTWFQ